MMRLACVAVGAAASGVFGQVMTFEGFAPPGGVMNVSPTSPYTEAGFTLTPSNSSSAVFDATATTDMPGNSNSSFFGWQEGNIITLTRNGGGPFSLQSVLLGPSTLAGGPASITLAAFFTSAPTQNMTFPNLTTATLAVVGWTDLTRVEFRTTDDAAMDNVVVPAPAGLGVLVAGGMLVGRRRRV
jgi:hypothetical protein